MVKHIRGYGKTFSSDDGLQPSPKEEVVLDEELQPPAKEEIVPELDNGPNIFKDESDIMFEMWAHIVGKDSYWELRPDVVNVDYFDSSDMECSLYFYMPDLHLDEFFYGIYVTLVIGTEAFTLPVNSILTSPHLLPYYLQQTPSITPIDDYVFCSFWWL